MQVIVFRVKRDVNVKQQISVAPSTDSTMIKEAKL